MNGRRPALTADSVTVRFGGVAALDEVSVAFHPGSICGLIGPNGAGKTTLFDVLSGLRAPTAGRVLLAERDVTGRPPTWRARHGMRRTFQRHQTFGWLTVEENVLAGLDARGGGGGLLADLVAFPTRARTDRHRREQVGAVLELCNLHDVRAEPAGKLPIGRARMVEFARAIVDPPQVLLLDEPTSGLEESEAAQLAAIVERMRLEHDCCIVLVEHDVGFVTGLCDRLVVLDLGRIIADGPPEAVCMEPEVRAAYLG